MDAPQDISGINNDESFYEQNGGENGIFLQFFAKKISKLFIKIDGRGSSCSHYYTESKTLIFLFQIIQIVLHLTSIFVHKNLRK